MAPPHQQSHYHHHRQWHHAALLGCDCSQIPMPAMIHLLVSIREYVSINAELARRPVLSSMHPRRRRPRSEPPWQRLRRSSWRKRRRRREVLVERMAVEWAAAAFNIYIFVYGLEILITTTLSAPCPLLPPGQRHRHRHRHRPSYRGHRASGIGGIGRAGGVSTIYHIIWQSIGGPAPRRRCPA